jgi:hypothetical protein
MQLYQMSGLMRETVILLLRDLVRFAHSLRSIRASHATGQAAMRMPKTPTRFFSLGTRWSSRYDDGESVSIFFNSPICKKLISKNIDRSQYYADG